MNFVVPSISFAFNAIKHILEIQAIKFKIVRILNTK